MEESNVEGRIWTAFVFVGLQSGLYLFADTMGRLSL